MKKNLGSNFDFKDNSDSYVCYATCFLTSACMMCFQDKFNDNWYELRVLRWLKQNILSNEEIKYCDKIVFEVIDIINKMPNSEIVYDYIYENFVYTCINALENGDYQLAHDQYKNSILDLEKIFVKKLIK